jgi:hypothetical protein
MQMLVAGLTVADLCSWAGDPVVVTTGGGWHAAAGSCFGGAPRQGRRSRRSTPLVAGEATIRAATRLMG